RHEAEPHAGRDDLLRLHLEQVGELRDRDELGRADDLRRLGDHFRAVLVTPAVPATRGAGVEAGERATHALLHETIVHRLALLLVAPAWTTSDRGTRTSEATAATGA